MAKISTEFDTIAKTLTVTVNGQAVANVDEVIMRKGYDEDAKFGCSLMTCVEDKENGVMLMTRLYASESFEGQAHKNTYGESKNLPGFVAVPVLPKVVTDIIQHFRFEK